MEKVETDRTGCRYCSYRQSILFTRVTECAFGRRSVFYCQFPISAEEISENGTMIIKISHRVIENMNETPADCPLGGTNNS